MIPFNKPAILGNEIDYIRDSVLSGKISGNGNFTELCHNYFQNNLGFNKCLLTTSCTDALEMAAILLNIKEGDEIIMPSFTFVSTANAFVLRGAKIVFSDSRSDHPCVDENRIESLVTTKTKVIVVVHYAGVACDMDIIMDISTRHNLFVVEDAAQAIDSYYKGRPLGSIGHLGAFSFHETKNIQCGEGGMLVVNDPQFADRAEIIWEKGTNRSAFFRGEVDKYGWVDMGSSFLPSEISAAFLWAQLENLEHIQTKRKMLWYRYFDLLYSLQVKGFIRIPIIPEYASNNAHMFYIICNSLEERTNLIEHLKLNNINAVFHYQSLHQSPFYLNKHNGRILNMCNFYSDTLLRLPLYYELTIDDIEFIVNKIKLYFK